MTAPFDDVVQSLLRLANKEMVEAMVAREAAVEVEKSLKASLEAGTSPEGEPWAPRKKDGGKPYQHAAAALTVKAYGNLISARITGPDAYGPYGVRGAPKRPMLPDAGGGIPPSVQKALDAAAARVFEELTK